MGGPDESITYYWLISSCPTRFSSGSWSPTAATLWKNCVTNWSQQEVKRPQWRSTCRRMLPRAHLPFRYTHICGRCGACMNFKWLVLLLWRTMYVVLLPAPCWFLIRHMLQNVSNCKEENVMFTLVPGSAFVSAVSAHFVNGFLKLVFRRLY